MLIIKYILKWGRTGIPALLPTQWHQDINSGRKTRSTFIKIVLTIPSTLHNTLTSSCFGLAIGWRTDLRSGQIKCYVKQVQGVEQQEEHIFCALSPYTFKFEYCYILSKKFNLRKVPSKYGRFLLKHSAYNIIIYEIYYLQLRVYCSISAG